MPSVKLSRDKRGYQYVSLLQSPGPQGSRGRLLYWFRSPSGLKVGREPFDREARRALSTRYPALTFDWKRLSEIPMPTPEEPWRERRRAERAAKVRAGDDEPPETAAPPGHHDDSGVPGEPALDVAPEDVEAPNEKGQVTATGEAEAGVRPLVPSDAKVAAQPAQSRSRRRRKRRRRDGAATASSQPAGEGDRHGEGIENPRSVVPPATTDN